MQESINRVELIRCEAEGLLHKNVLACPKRLNDQPGMGVVARGDYDRIDIRIIDDLPYVGSGLGKAVFDGKLGGGFGPP